MIARFMTFYKPGVTAMLLGESYSGILALADFTHDVTKYQQHEEVPTVLAASGDEELVNYYNTRFIKGHKPSNHIRAKIKSHVYTIE